MMESGETLLNNHWLGNRVGSLSFLVRTISNVLIMEIGWTDVGSRGYILVSCAHSNTSFMYPNVLESRVLICFCIVCIYFQSVPKTTSP